MNPSKLKEKTALLSAVSLDSMSLRYDFNIKRVMMLQNFCWLYLGERSHYIFDSVVLALQNYASFAMVVHVMSNQNYCIQMHWNEVHILQKASSFYQWQFKVPRWIWTSLYTWNLWQLFLARIISFYLLIILNPQFLFILASHYYCSVYISVTSFTQVWHIIPKFAKLHAPFSFSLSNHKLGIMLFMRSELLTCIHKIWFLAYETK